MEFKLFFVFLLFLIFDEAISQLSPYQKIEQTLVKNIFTGYTKTTRPSDTVDVGVSVSIKQIISLDEKNQILTTSCYMSQLWYDGRLSWNTSLYNDTQFIMVPLKNIWTPDTIILNSADGDGFLKINSDFSLAQLNNDGSVYYLTPLIGLKTRCALNVQNYPFDKQSCNIRFTSWSNDDTRIAYNVNDTYISFQDFTNNTVWTVTDAKISSVVTTDRVVFTSSKNIEIILSLSIQRKPLYYMMNTVFPCFILNLVTLLIYYMPVGAQIGLALNGFLTFSVYSLRISSDIPVQSDYLPKISVYFISSITFNIITMFWSTYRIRLTSTGKLPKYLDLFCEKLESKIFCLCFDNDTNKTKNKKNDEKNLEIKDSARDLAIKALDKANTSDQKKEDFNMALKEFENLQLKKEQKEKNKCEKCDVCGDCEIELKKEKDKAKQKKVVEKRLEAFNYFLLLIMFIAILITQLGIWTSFQ